MRIFPKHPSAPDTYHIGGAWTPACITAVDKRFRTSELAAEYWRLCYYGVNARFGDIESADKHYERLDTLHRFATLPHYDENPA